MIATHLVFFFFAGTPAPPVTPEPVVQSTAQSGGGGSASRLYRGKYRDEVRKAIQSAIEGTRREQSARPGKLRRERVREIARDVQVALDIAVAPEFVLAQEPDLAALEVIRRQVLSLATSLAEIETARRDAWKVQAERELEARRRTAALQAAMVAYVEEALKSKRREEESIISFVIALDHRN